MTYNYKNPDRFFCEPLMRYVLTPLGLGLLSLIPIAIYSSIIGDGGESLRGTILEYYVTATLTAMLPLLVVYSILYAVRGWGNKEKWGMKDLIKERVEKDIAEGKPDHNLRRLIIIFVVMIGMLAFGVYIWYEVSDNLDYEKWHIMLTTNQTYVDSFGCDKVEKSLALLNQAVSPRPEHNKMIEQIKLDYKQVGLEKKCDFIIKDLRP